MNFKKMRQKTRADGTPSRSWEQGFLAASCGEKGLENIGYSKVTLSWVMQNSYDVNCTTFLN
jgi:hypothetical protein